MKRFIAIFCLTALLLSTSSLTYFYWVQEKVHEQERFASIDAGRFTSNEEGLRVSSERHQIKLVLKDKSILPEGYTWEEKGRELSHNGMFYDIIALKHTQNGWELTAASDEVEAAIVNNQHKANNLEKETTSTKSSNSIKIKISKLVYDYVTYDAQAFNASNLIGYPEFINSRIANPFLALFAPPPELV